MNSKTVIVILNISIKNQVTMSITHIHVYGTPIVKTIYHAINVTSTEAELFVIRCGLNQATQLTNIKHIVVITNSIYTTERIFDSSIHLYQIQILFISKKLRKFFWKKSSQFH